MFNLYMNMNIQIILTSHSLRYQNWYLNFIDNLGYNENDV